MKWHDLADDAAECGTERHGATITRNDGLWATGEYSIYAYTRDAEYIGTKTYRTKAGAMRAAERWLEKHK